MENYEDIDVSDLREHLDESFEGRLEVARRARGLALEMERLTEELKVTTREYAKQYEGALRAGWSATELTKFGLPAPTKRTRKPRKNAPRNANNNAAEPPKTQATTPQVENAWGQ